jgi:amino acid transporter
VAQTAINIVLATTGTFEQLAIAANGSILIVYGLCALAVLVLRRKDVHSTEVPYVAPLGGVVPVLAFAAILWLLLSLTRPEWSALAIITAAALIVFAATRGARDARGIT